MLPTICAMCPQKIITRAKVPLKCNFANKSALFPQAAPCPFSILGRTLSIDLIQNWPPMSNRRRIKIIKLTVGFCLPSGCDIHPAGNPTVRQLPSAIAITELSIQCHLASSFQLVDVAGMRSCDTDRLRSLVMLI